MSTLSALFTSPHASPRCRTKLCHPGNWVPAEGKGMKSRSQDHRSDCPARCVLRCTMRKLSATPRDHPTCNFTSWTSQKPTARPEVTRSNTEEARGLDDSCQTESASPVTRPNKAMRLARVSPALVVSAPAQISAISFPFHGLLLRLRCLASFCASYLFVFARNAPVFLPLPIQRQLPPYNLR